MTVPTAPDTLTLLLTLFAALLGLVALQAWRYGNERRDIALLGTTSGCLAAGALISSLW
jgi:hypothetical protein